MYAADDWAGSVFPPEGAPRLAGFVFRIPVHMKAVFSSHERMTRAGDRRGRGRGVPAVQTTHQRGTWRGAWRATRCFRFFFFLCPDLWGIHGEAAGVFTL